MTGAIAPETAQHLRAVLDEILHRAPEVPPHALAAFERLVDVLEANTDAAIFAANETVSTQKAAALLGVSRMTVVRLVDRGEITAGGGAVHRRISVSELARYQADSSSRRRSAVTELADDLDEDTPPDEVTSTR